MQVRRRIATKTTVPGIDPPPQAVCAASNNREGDVSGSIKYLEVVRDRARTTSSGIRKSGLRRHPKRGYISKAKSRAQKTLMKTNEEHAFNLYRQAREWAKARLALQAIYPKKLGGATHDGRLWKTLAAFRYSYLKATPRDQRCLNGVSAGADPDELSRNALAIASAGG